MLGVVHHDVARPVRLGPAAVAVGEGLGMSLAGLGVFATAYYAGYVISNVAGGALTDRVGARAVLLGSLLVAGGGMLAFGSSRSAGAGIALQGLIGLFAGADYSAGLKLVATWFPGRERGTGGPGGRTPGRCWPTVTCCCSGWPGSARCGARTGSSPGPTRS
ncbi:MFS transporter [Nonomuraea sp. ATR24]|uniref:MFS transporter n=1 Tax=Nonomuraea sp. ATR24 TaxID=1676744 RepID=UPI0035BF1D7E